jgi:cytochrome c biogenesis protein ResB
MTNKELQPYLLRMSLMALFGLTVLSIVGAFLGVERARLFFNSIPMMLIWLFLLGLLMIGIVCSAGIRKRPASLAMHLGCVLVLAGAMWGSQTAQHWRAVLQWSSGPTTGYLLLKSGDISDRLTDSSLIRTVGQLPFSIRLEDFRIEYYPLGNEAWAFGLGVAVPSSRGMDWLFQPLEWNTGVETHLPYGDIRMFVLNHKIQETSALVELELLHGTNSLLGKMKADVTNSFYHLPLAPLFPDVVFSNRSASLLLMRNEAPIRQYVSTVTLLKEAQEVGRREISVNHPLHYGGYHIYQHSYGKDGELYTILYAVKDSGLVWVYAGFILLGLGTAVHFWSRRGRSRNGGEA